MKDTTRSRRKVTKRFPLRVVSAYSFSRGAVLPDHWARTAAETGYEAILLTDWGNLYGALPFLTEARRVGIKPALGVELPLSANDQVANPANPKTVLLICEDVTGYHNLCHIITALAESEVADPWLVLRENRQGLYFLTEARELLGQLKSAAGQGRAAALLPWPPRSSQQEFQLRKSARRLEVPLVALPLANMLNESQRSTMRVLTAIVQRDFLPDDHPGAAALPSLREVRSYAEKDHVAYEAGRRLVARCRLDITDLMPERFIFPILSSDSDGLLRRRCEGSLHRLGFTDSPKAWQRLNTELAIIKKLGFSDYFLATSRVTSWARRSGIATMGRGSGVASLVAYLLGITGVDPIEYQLHFERFLHLQRKDYPDIDIDVAWDRRGEVIDYMLRVFGSGRAAMISTHQFFRPRGAWRAAARTLGLDDEQIKRASRHLPRFFFGEPEMKSSNEDGDTAAADQAGLAVLSRLTGESDGRIHRAAELAIGISGLPCGIGIHVGGVVLADRPISRLVPLERSANGVIITQFEMKAIEKIGLIKIDILGNRALGTIAETSLLTGSPEAGEPVSLDDHATGKLVASGKTLGCFQLESPAMRTLQKQLQTKDLAGVIAAIALIRPGPSSSGMKGSYIKRELGEEEATAIHPDVAGLLRETHGLPLYEEDIMRLAAAVTGLDYGGSDMLRRAICEAASGRSREIPPEENEELNRIRDGFFRLAWRQGKPTAAEPVWEQLTRFASYSFCKAHAAGFGKLAFHTAFLKAHYPGPFLVALLNHHRGMYPTRVYVDEARRMGLTVKPPSIWESERSWRWAESSETIRCPLTRVKGIREDTEVRIIKAREEAAFRSLADFVFRVRPTSLELEALLLAGAFDEQLSQPRGELLWEAQRLMRSRQGAIAEAHLERSGQQTLALSYITNQETARGSSVCCDGKEAPVRSSRKPIVWRDISRHHRARLERRFLGLSISMHPVDIWRSEKSDERSSSDPRIANLLAEGEGLVKVTGLVSAYRNFTGKDGTPGRFFTLEDDSGLLECTMRGRAVLRENSSVSIDDIVEVTGRLTEVFSACGLQVRSVKIVGKH